MKMAYSMVLIDPPLQRKNLISKSWICKNIKIISFARNFILWGKIRKMTKSLSLSLISPENGYISKQHIYISSQKFLISVLTQVKSQRQSIDRNQIKQSAHMLSFSSLKEMNTSKI